MKNNNNNCGLRGLCIQTTKRFYFYEIAGFIETWTFLNKMVYTL